MMDELKGPAPTPEPDNETEAERVFRTANELLGLECELPMRSVPLSLPARKELVGMGKRC